MIESFARDSFKTAIPAATTRRERLALLLSTSRELMESNRLRALDCAKNALSIAESLADPVEQRRCLIQLGLCQLACSDAESSRKTLQKAYQLARSSAENSPSEMAPLLLALGNARLQTGDYHGALESYRQALELYASESDILGIAAACRSLGALHGSLGDHPKSLDYFLRALELVDRGNDDDAAGELLGNIAVVHGQLEDYDRALEFFDDALCRFRRSGNRLLEVRMLVNIANAHYALDRLAPALETALTVMTIYEALGMKQGLAESLVITGKIYEKMGRLDVALGYQLKAHEILDEPADDRTHAPVLLNIGSLFRKTGRINDAVYMLEQALLLADRNNDRALAFEIHERLSETCEQLGDVTRALYHLRQASSIRAEVQSREKQKTIAELQVRFDVERAEKEKEIYRLQSEHQAREMQHMQKELNAKTLNLVERAGFIEEIRSDVLEIERLSDRETRALARKLLRKLTGHANLDEGWRAFEEQFEQVHHDFMGKLIQRYPELAPMELKICALTRAGLETKEIASLLHVTTRAIQGHRYRIKKKLQLTVDLITFLMGM
jgi:tetratricopeptide (TPR) repeat protein